MMADEDRSGLFNEIQKFSQRKLKKVNTKVVTGLGDKLVEKRGAKGLTTVKNDTSKDNDSAKPKCDLQVGLVLPGLMIGKHQAIGDVKDARDERERREREVVFMQLNRKLIHQCS